MVDEDDFNAMEIRDQARALIDLGERAMPFLDGFEDVSRIVGGILAQTKELLEGQMDRLDEVLRFMNDSDLGDDYSVYSDWLSGDAAATDALDIAAFSIGFTARACALEAGRKALPDTVLEALPDVAGYYFERARGLGL